MSLAEKLPSPPSVHEVLATALTANTRLTLHELERAAALHGHAAIEVEMVLKALVRDHVLERALVFRLREDDADVSQVDADDENPRLKKLTLRLVEQVNAAPPLQLVDVAEAARAEVTSIIARVQESSKDRTRKRYAPRAAGEPQARRGKSAFWGQLWAAVKELPLGQTHYLVHPERTAKVLAKQTSTMLVNWRTARQLEGRFKCRVTDRGVLITRIE